MCLSQSRLRDYITAFSSHSLIRMEKRILKGFCSNLSWVEFIICREIEKLCPTKVLQFKSENKSREWIETREALIKS